MPSRPRSLTALRQRGGPPVAIAGIPPRASAHRRGYTRGWQAFRLRVLADVAGVNFPQGGPLCRVCGQPATDVDHIRPHRGDRELLYDPTNVQSLCHSCHSRKTASEDGGFGRGSV
jgi:5-methylcytosine-specific restriction enzyme A